jgi:hypothetical protein
MFVHERRELRDSVKIFDGARGRYGQHVRLSLARGLSALVASHL